MNVRARNAEIVAFARDNAETHTVREIARRFGQSYNVTFSLLRRAGIKVARDQCGRRAYMPNCLTVEDYRACAKAGLTRQQTARHLSRSIRAVKHMSAAYGLRFDRACKRFDGTPMAGMTVRQSDRAAALVATGTPAKEAIKKVTTP
ncbi:hypothetical protein AN189_07350 [Loktanella sp. 3ANDIMAR09]|uniref:hypothetical protein n=1 Tax=Loktanella sp. 3ANDIMAR09 TaxID=1225657 RepID=UPI0006F47E9F|nr:hypothetical protein [Loktanella sp. 3ANDIMAR09]KQI68709.1 hypothetical protein AN189_07350 [Loktanella sp. 3ANDIMAR09]